MFYPLVIKHGNWKWTIYRWCSYLKPPFIGDFPLPCLITRGWVNLFCLDQQVPTSTYLSFWTEWNRRRISIIYEWWGQSLVVLYWQKCYRGIPGYLSSLPFWSQGQVSPSSKINQLIPSSSESNLDLRPPFAKRFRTHMTHKKNLGYIQHIRYMSGL